MSVEFNKTTGELARACSTHRMANFFCITANSAMRIAGVLLVLYSSSSTIALAQTHTPQSQWHNSRADFPHYLMQSKFPEPSIVVIPQNSTQIIPPLSHSARLGTYYVHGNRYYYTLQTATVGGRGAQHVVAQRVVVPFGGFSHVDDLAGRLTTLANEFLLDLHYNYSHNAGFKETYREAYQLLDVAKFIRAADHNRDGSAMREKLGGMDPLFHHIQNDVKGWSRVHRKQVGSLGVLTTMEMIEATLHHLMNDAGVPQTPVPGAIGPSPPPVRSAKASEGGEARKHDLGHLPEPMSPSGKYPEQHAPAASGNLPSNFSHQNYQLSEHGHHSHMQGKYPEWQPYNFGHTALHYKSSDDVDRILPFSEAERLAKDGVASSQGQLAQLYIDYGHYDDAIVQLERVLEHYLQEPSAAERYVVASNRLARVHLELGQFALAKQRLEENVKRLSELQVQTTTANGDALGDTLVLQAELYRETGDFQLAESLHRRILQRRSEVFGEEHREYAVALHNYGIFQWRQEQFQQAEDLLRRELQLTEQLAPESRELAHSRESLALALTSQGKLAEAEKLFLAALQTYERLPGNERDRYRTLNNLAYLHIFDGEHDEALTLFAEAVSGRKSLLGEDHLDYADTLADTARLRLARGEFQQAIEASRQSLAITRQSLELTSATQSERQQLAMANLFRERLDLLLTAAANSAGSAQEAFAEILAWKGSTLVRQRMMRNLSQQESISLMYKELQQITMRIASLSRSSPADSAAIDNWKTELLSMRTEKESLEAKLSQMSAEFRLSQAVPTLESLSRALPSDAILIDYFQYASLAPDPAKGQFNRTPSLMASVMKPDGSVQCIHFGSTEPIARSIDIWRESLGFSPESSNAGRRLRATIWEPLLPIIGDAQTLLVSTDGPLGRLPIAALPGRGEGTYLIEDHRIAMVPVPQLIPMLVTRNERRQLPNHLLLMGDVDYDKPNQELLASHDAALPWERRELSVARAGSETFARLEHTAGEIAAIERLYKNTGWSKPDGIITLDGRDATESRFRELAPRCYQLHLATHGFFATPNVPNATASALSRTDSQLARENGFTIRGVSPGLLSGLAFSGANAKPQPGRDDGILTADEIAFLPLDGVELVVLSACETGLGEMAGGEGLLGIQRSFQVSGARTTVASLWMVPDLATRLLMERFYSNYWGQEKMSRLDALRAAQLWVLRHPDDLRGVVRDVNEIENRKTPPEYWGAFVLSGDWR